MSLRLEFEDPAVAQQHALHIEVLWSVWITDDCVEIDEALGHPPYAYQARCICGWYDKQQWLVSEAGMRAAALEWVKHRLDVATKLSRNPQAKRGAPRRGPMHWLSCSRH